MRRFKEMVYQKERLDKPEVLFDEEYLGFRIIGMSLGTHPVAYVGLPENHIFAGFDYFDLAFINVHGGFTYSERGDGNYLPKGYWWYGWDYAHSGDWKGYFEGSSEFLGRRLKRWTTEEIYDEAKYVAEQMFYLEEFVEVMLKKFIGDVVKTIYKFINE